MRLPPLVTDNDFSLIPEDYHGAIEAYCEYKGFRLKKDYQGASMSKQDFEEYVAQAVADDEGPERDIVMQDYYPGVIFDDDDLPGNYPRE